MRLAVIIAFLFIAHFHFAQILEKELSEVEVSDANNRIKSNEEQLPGLDRKKIQELQMEDAGQLLQKIAGVQVKSYGGLGGLKSVSIRGLGGQHTNFVVDGFSVFPDQTGQVNFGVIQVDNIERITVLNGRSGNNSAAALSSGNSVLIRTFENGFSAKKNEIRFSQKLGSFGQTDSYLAYKKGHHLNRHFFSMSAKYRLSEGDYPYRIENGQHISEGLRNNNQYNDLNVTASGGYRIKNKTFLSGCVRHQSIKQQLPGAVILYNSYPDETLDQITTHAQLDLHTYFFSKWNLRFFSSATINEMQYKDPGYLNAEGFLESNYLTKTFLGGLNIQHRSNRSWLYAYHMDHYLSSLESEQITHNEVLRNHHYSVVSIRFTPKDMGEFYGQISNQLVHEQVNGADDKMFYQVNPFFEYQSPVLRNHMKLLLFYRNSFRMPSFNELYYNNIGNSDLSPEKAHQFSIGLEKEEKRNKLEAVNRLNIYTNLVQDKIVAIPTQNLFLWSIQNIGKVQIVGLDITSDITLTINTINKVNLSVNYTFQHVTDITDPESPTYGHQVAYLPRNSGNADVSYYWKNYGVRGSVYANGIRYSLNENTTSNQMNEFAIVDLSLFGNFTRKNHTFSLNVSCKNLMNSSYSFVRNYVMPGRNYLITLSYALN